MAELNETIVAARPRAQSECPGASCLQVVAHSQGIAVRRRSGRTANDLSLDEQSTTPAVLVCVLKLPIGTLAIANLV
jgi:hypothetical protein